MTVAVPALAQGTLDFAEDATDLAVGQPIFGDIQAAHDIEWYAVELDGGQTYTIDVGGQATGQGTLGDPLVILYDAEGNELARDDDGGDGLNSRLSFTPEQSAAYAIAVSAFGPSTGDFTLAVSGGVGDAAAPATAEPAGAPDDLAASSETTGRVAVGGSATGELESAGDGDWFAIDLQAGQQVVIDLQGAPTGAGTLADPLVTLFNSDGAEVDRNDDGGEGLNSQLTFTAPQAGTYYVGAGAFGSATGTYQVAVAGLGEAPAAVAAEAPAAGDDHPASVDTTATLEPGGSTTGDLETEGDRDWFAISLAAGQTVDLALEGGATGQGTLSDPYLTLFDQAGNEVGRNDDGGEGLNSQLSFTAPAAGIYYVEARGFADDYGTYRLTASLEVAQQPLAPSDDFPADAGTSGQLQIGGSIGGNLEAAGDQDWFAISLSEGQTVILDLEGAPTGQGTLADPYVSVFDTAGTEIQRNDDGGDGLNSRLEFTAPTAGTYFVQARGFGDNSGTYRLSAQAGTPVAPPQPIAAADDYSGGVDTTGRIGVGTSVAGNLEAENDTDWFAIDLSQGQTVVLDLEGSPTGQGSLGDPYLTVFDFAGTEIDSNDDGGSGFNSQLEFTAPASGTYYVEARGFAGDFGTYSLSAQPVATAPTPVADDYSNDPGTAGQIGVGGSLTGNLEAPDDEDWFAILLGAGQSVLLDLEGSPTGQGTLSDPYLTVYDQFGNELDRSDDGGQGYNSQLTFTAPAAGIYYLEARGFAGDNGTYRLSAAPATVADDYPADQSTSGSVAVGGREVGVLEEAGDRDWFALQLTGGQTVDVFLEGTATGQGSLGDPLMVIYDQFGNEVGRNDDGGEGLNSMLSFSAPSDGTYYVSAEAFGSSTGSYALHVDDVTPVQPVGKGPSDDYAGDASSTGSVAVNGTATGTIEQAEDTDWFALQLNVGQVVEISLEGQPTGAGTLADPVLAVFDQFGYEVAYDDDGGDSWNSLLTFVAPSSGTYYVSAEGFGDATGSYLISVVPGVQDDYPGDLSTTGILGIGRSMTGSIDSPGDTDWFALNLNAGQPVVIRQLGSDAGGGTLPDPYLELYDGNGIFIDSNDDDGESFNSAIAFTPRLSGQYYVAAGAFADYIGSYTLTVEIGALARDDYASDPSTVGQAQLNSTVYGELETPEDEDWFFIQLQPGNYVIDLEGQPTGMGSLSDPYLVLYNAQGVEIDRNDDGGQGFNSQLRVSVGAPATYFIGARAFGGNIGTYALTVTGGGGIK